MRVLPFASMAGKGTISISAAILFTLSFSFSETAPALVGPEDRVVRVYARALDTKRGETAFLEERTQTFRKEHCIHQNIRYFSADSVLIAEKDIDQSRGYRLPEVRVVQYRTELRKSVSFRDGKAVIKVTEKGREKEKSIAVTGMTVFDAGIGNMIRDSVGTLIKGNQIVFDLLAAERFAAYRFIMEKDESSTDILLVIRMEPASWLLKVLLDPILMSYNVKEDRMVRYKGISDIRDADGNHLTVDIEYPSAGEAVPDSLSYDPAKSRIDP